LMVDGLMVQQQRSEIHADDDDYVDRDGTRGRDDGAEC